MAVDQYKINIEFERQVANLLAKGYQELLLFSKEEFVNRVNFLKEKLIGLSLPELDLEMGKLHLL